MGERENPAALKIANDIIAAYKPESVKEMHAAIKDVFEPMFEAIGRNFFCREPESPNQC